MTFARRGPPGGWPVNPILTHDQLNNLDIDHANAVDRSSAGDTIAGAITLLGPKASLVSRVNTTVTGAGSQLRTQSGGRILLDDNDWPQYSTPRSLVRACPFLVQPGPAFLHWTVDLNQSIAQSSVGLTGNVNISDALTDGSVLTAIDIYFAVSAGHSGFSGAPTTMPSLTLFRQAILEISDLQAIATGTIPTPASGAAWYNSGNVQSYTLIVPALTVDNVEASYYLQVVDENGTLGTNVAVGNTYQSLRMNFASSDMRPA